MRWVVNLRLKLAALSGPRAQIIQLRVVHTRTEQSNLNVWPAGEALLQQQMTTGHPWDVLKPGGRQQCFRTTALLAEAKP